MSSHSEVRKVSMKVLCLGYSRTGTDSLRNALTMLGLCHVYHGYDLPVGDPYQYKLWLDALRAKHDGIGRKPDREFFDQLLGHCQAVTDMPAAIFAEELVEAYPDAKVILTIRDADKRYQSAKNTFEDPFFRVAWPTIGFTATLLRMPNRWCRPMFQKMEQVLYESDFEKNGLKSFQQHCDLVRSLVPKEKLLEYHVSDGWEPLCKFLDQPVPAADFPYTNQAQDHQQTAHEKLLADAKSQGKRVLDIVAYTCLGVWLLSVLMATFPQLKQGLSPWFTNG